MVKKITSNIFKIFASFFIASLLLMSIFYLFLKEGIQIDYIKLPLIQIEKLYLKYDKKLILKIDRLNIKKEKKKNRKKDIENFIKSFKYLPKFFQEVNIKNIDFLNYHVTFLYTDKIYFIDTDKYQFSAKLKIKDSKIFAHIPQFFYKDFGFFADGNAIFDLKRGFFSFKGKYNISDIKGDIKTSLIKNRLLFFIDSDYFTNDNLKDITEKFTLNKEIKNWIYKYIVAKKYKLKYLKADFDINKKNFYDPNKIEGIAYANNAYIRFNPKAKRVKCEKIEIKFKNDSLYFKLFNPKYQNKNLKGSYVVIKNLTKPNSYIDIVIKTKTPVDNEIKNLLLAYDIKLPIIQKKGFTNALVKIRVIFKTGDLDVKGYFSTKDSQIYISGIDLGVKNAVLNLHNNSLIIKNSFINIDDFIKTKAFGEIFFDKKIAKITLNDLNLNLKFNENPILDIKNLKEYMYIDFKNSKYTKIDLKNLNSKIKIYPDKISIFIKDIKNLEKFSTPLKKADIKNGNLKIETKDYKIFNVEGIIKKDNKILADKKGNFIKIFNFKGTISKKETKIFINKKIVFKYINFLQIYINDYDIYLKKDQIKQKTNQNRFYVYGKNANIIINGHKMLSEKFSLKKEKKDFVFQNIYKNSNIKIFGKSEDFEISAKNLNDRFIKSFFNIYGIEGGKYFLKAKGNIENLKGKAWFYNANLKDLALINNIMAFLNTVPALVTFSDPGYSTKGFKVKKGEIDFRLKDSILNIDSLKFIGKSMNVEGIGEIDLKKNTINMKLKLQTLKKVTDIIKKIPIAGYILLGKEGKISTVLKIEGDLVKPKISTKLPQETIKAPVNIIKRTLELPFKIFK